MSRNSVWTNSDGLSVGYGTRDVTTTGSHRIGDTNAIQKLYLEVTGADLADAVAVTEDQVVHGVVIPNGATILGATFEVVTAFVGATATLDLGVYDKDGTIVDDDGIDAAIAVTAIDAVGDTIACDGADINTVVATTGGVKICASYDTAAFTAGFGILTVEYVPA